MRDTLIAWLSATASKTGAVITGLTAIGGFYVSLGGPVPASVGYVDALERRLTITSLEDRRALFRLSRYFMGNEAAALDRTVEKLADGPDRASLERRRREIREQLEDVGDEDEAARRRLQELKR